MLALRAGNALLALRVGDGVGSYSSDRSFRLIRYLLRRLRVGGVPENIRFDPLLRFDVQFALQFQHITQEDDGLTREQRKAEKARIKAAKAAAKHH